MRNHLAAASRRKIAVTITNNETIQFDLSTSQLKYKRRLLCDSSSFRLVCIPDLGTIVHTLLA